MKKDYYKSQAWLSKRYISDGKNVNEKLAKGISFGTEYGWITLQGAINKVVVVTVTRSSNSKIFSELVLRTLVSIVFEY